MDYKVVVATCDTHRHLLHGFAHQQQKYWSGTGLIDVICETQPVTGLPAHYQCLVQGAGSWSDILIRYLHRYCRRQSKPILFMLDDYWLSEPVRNAAIDYAAMDVWFNGVHKVDLNQDRVGFAHEHYDDDYIKSAVDADYLTSTQAALWEPRFFLSTLRAGESPWAYELDGTERLRGMPNLCILSLKTPPLQYARVVSRDPHTYLLNGLSPDDQHELQAKGCLIERERA